MQLHLNEGWKRRLAASFSTPSYLKLLEFLDGEYQQHVIYPPQESIFEALNRCAFNEVRVVIIGQDPYHGPGQAHGLCFSVNESVKPPPSLVTIFKETKSDTGRAMPANGNLTRWADQGVLLLNAVLTVRAHEAGSHQKKGWEHFTDEVIREISVGRENVVFLLWGNYAAKKAVLIDEHRHCILRSAHPSPLSAYRGFLGNRHFSQANAYLMSHGQAPIEW